MLMRIKQSEQWNDNWITCTIKEPVQFRNISRKGYINVDAQAPFLRCKMNQIPVDSDFWLKSNTVV